MNKLRDLERIYSVYKALAGKRNIDIYSVPPEWIRITISELEYAIRCIKLGIEEENQNDNQIRNQ